MSRRLSGTSPSTMRWARPSTIAVLPTPGSPISTGLFLVRRLSTCTTRRISLSRPMTGSSLPSRARVGQVGGVLLQRLVGRFGVGAGDAGAAAHFDERVAQRLRRCAVSGQQLGDLGVAGGQTHHQVLGGDVFVVHLGGQLLRGGDGGQRFTRQLRLRVGAAGLRQPVQDALRFGADGGGLDADSLQQRRGDPVVLREQGQQQVSRPDLGVAGGSSPPASADVSTACVLVVGLKESTTPPFCAQSGPPGAR